MSRSGPAPSSSPPLPPAAPRASRSDGAQARERLLLVALRLFAEGGFAKTSTRAIAQAAGANIAAISYYFGDKAGLYAACFVEPMGGNASDLVAQFAADGLPLETALRIFMNGYTQPLKRGEIVRQCMRLHLREMLEPTGQMQGEFERDVCVPHEAMVRVLCRHLQLRRPDDDVHRLALSIAGLAMQLFVMQEKIGILRPGLLDTAQQIDTWTERLFAYALALVGAEQARRAAGPPARPAPSDLSMPSPHAPAPAARRNPPPARSAAQRSPHKTK